MNHNAIFKKGISLVLCFVMALHLSGGISVKASNQDVTVSEITISVTPIGGNESIILSTNNNISSVVINDSIDQDSTFKIHYKLEAPTTPGDTVNPLILPLPQDFKITDALKNSEHSDPNGVFTYRFVDSPVKQIEVTFSVDKLKENPENMFIEALSSFDVDANSTDNMKTISMPNTLLANKSYKLRFLPKNIDRDVSKKGVFLHAKDNTEMSEPYNNPHQIKWTIDINKQLKQVPASNAIVIDTFDATKLSFQDGSLKIYPLNITMNGAINHDPNTALNTSDYDFEKRDSGFQITFKGNTITDGHLTKAYRIEYITDIKESVGGKNIVLNNTANFKGASPVTASVTIHHKTADSLTSHTRKSATYIVTYDGTGQKNWLRWTINTNLSERKIDSIEDTLPQGLTLIRYSSNPFDPQTNPDAGGIYDQFTVMQLKPEAVTKDNPPVTDYIYYQFGELLTQSRNSNPHNLDYRDISDIFTITYDNIGRKIKLVPKTDAASTGIYTIRYDTKITDASHVGQNGFENNVTVKTPVVGNFNGNYTGKAVSGKLKSEIGKALDASLTRKNDPAYGYHINYDTNEVRWIITIDPKAGQMENLVISDTFPNSGLEMVPFNGDTYFKISKNSTFADNTLFANQTDYSATIPEDPVTGKKTAGFNIRFHNPLKDIVYVLYKTKFDRQLHNYKNDTTPIIHDGSAVNKPITPSRKDERNLFRNQLNAQWGNNQTSPTRDIFFEAHPYVKDNGGKIVVPANIEVNGKQIKKVINPADRTITWLIYTNFNGEDIAPVITDTIGEGHILLEDSIKVKEYTRNTENGNPQNFTEISSADDIPSNLYSLQKTDNGFTLSFKKSSNKRYAIVYKTVLKDEKSLQKYLNTANLNNKNVMAQANFSDYTTFLFKDGKQRSITAGTTWFIDWSLDINYSLSKMDNVVIRDTLSTGQMLDDSSFVLRNYPDMTEVDKSLYELKIFPLDEVSRQAKFELKFLSPIKHAYLLNYSSVVVNKTPPFNPTNSVSISSDNIQNMVSPSPTNVRFVAASTNAGSEFAFKTIQIRKKAAPNGELLPGVRFELWRDGSLFKSFEPTDNHGITSLNNLPYSTKYVIKEVLTPDSKYLPLDDIPVVFTSSSTLRLEVENTLKPTEPITPYVPADPKEETPQDPTKEEIPKQNTPKEEAPEDNRTNTPEPKKDEPQGDTTKTEEPTTPSTPNTTNTSTPDVPSAPIEGEINIPDDNVPTIKITPENGKVILVGKQWKYTPNKGFYGKDKFTVKITTPDGKEYDEIIEINVPIPQGSTTLPQTDGLPAPLFYFLGGVAILAAFGLKRK